MLFKPKPMIAGQTVDDASSDYKGSRRIEKYRVGRECLYIPDGLFWKYLPIRCIEQVCRKVRIITSDNGVCPFAMEAPAILISFGEETEMLELEKEKNAKSLEELLCSGRDHI